jgi:uncharacterized membrane protein
MKSFILWTLGIAFMFLAMTAVDMGEWTLALVMGAISCALVFATPSKAKKAKKDTATADRW